LILFRVTCTCCGAEYTAADWAGLNDIGVQEVPGVALELRNCPCGTTLSYLLADTGYGMVL
jgi:hypothetical protein